MPDIPQPEDGSDLSGPAPLLIPVPGTSDPADLDYGGFLNLVGYVNLAGSPGRPLAPCSLHPAHLVGADGCARCREIMRVRRMLGALALVLALVDAYREQAAALAEATRGDDAATHVRAQVARDETEQLLQLLGIDFAADPGGRVHAQWTRPF